MSDDHEHTKCKGCGETVRADRTKGGVCVNCIALGTKPKAAKAKGE